MTDDKNYQLNECLDLLRKFFGDDDRPHFWMNTPNPDLGGVVPLHLIAIGRGHKVLAFIRSRVEKDKV